MKIVLTGGGTGGHFYPMLAVGRALLQAADEVRQIDLRIVFMANEPFDARALENSGIRFVRVRSGKIRRYFSLQNLIDPFRTFSGILGACWKFFIDPPDAVFSTGGGQAFPMMIASRIFRVPVLMYDADTVPGRVSAYTAKFAERIAINFPEAATHFPRERVALTGHPIRKEIFGGVTTIAYDHLGMTDTLPVLVVLGGSQGAEALNDVIINALPRLREHVHVIHQTGATHAQLVKDEITVIEQQTPNTAPGTYMPKGFLSEEELRDVAVVARIVVARAGAGTISEIAAWGVPSILIPLPAAAGDHQRMNAYAYARTGAAEVLEQQNCTPNVLSARIEYILANADVERRMKTAAKSFAHPEAALTIARELLQMARHA